MPPVSCTEGRVGQGVASGTCGELAQGVLPDGQPFLVTCPIALGAQVDVCLTPAAEMTVRGLSPALRKLTRALLQAAELLELPPSRIAATHRTELQTGKGMASSSADITAAVRALAAAAGQRLPDAQIGRLAASIESSDGVMFSGLAVVDHRAGTLLRSWDWWPQFTVLMVVPRATLTTSTVRLDGQERHAEQYAALLNELDAAVAARDGARFAAQATVSAQLSREYVPNALADQLLERRETLGALGVCVAHTGTVAGLLYDAGPSGEQQAEEASAALATTFAGDVQRVITCTPPGPVDRASSLPG